MEMNKDVEDKDVQLCPELRPIYELEIFSGNVVERVEKLAYTKCDLAVVFSKPLHFDEIEKQVNLPSSVERWANKDSHYSIEAGYYCRACKHSMAGPD
ncbi:MAG: hypothetical protein NT166_14200 [Candidatus Aminicenantes bacterium]|nr:hypothetical protein [Candidatus Aminicenantes bacterium]